MKKENVFDTIKGTSRYNGLKEITLDRRSKVCRLQKGMGIEMKSLKLAAGLCLLAVLLSGCGQTTVPEEISEPSLVIGSDGEVTAYLVGEFDKSYYDLSELAAMAREEAAEFGRPSSDGTMPVTLDSVEAVQDGSGRVVVAYRFEGTASYKEFLGNELFYGTVGEAIAQGYLSDMVFQSVGNGSPMTSDALAAEKERHLIITNAAAVIYCPSKVTHVSTGAVVNSDGSVDASQASDTVYIILKK